MNDPNTVIRLISFQTVIEAHELFPTEYLAEKFVPPLLKELRSGWNNGDNWLLQNYEKVLNFLTNRKFLQASQMDVIYKFYDVFLNWFFPH